VTTVEDAQGALAASGGAQVEARGYWEQVWRRFRKDKLAVLSLGFIVVLFTLAFIGAPVAEKLVGHDPYVQYSYGALDQTSNLPVGPWTWVDTSPYEGAQGDFPETLFVLGADPLGRDLMLRLLYGARTSLEVAVLATTFALILGVIAGLLAGLYRGWVDTVLSRMIEIVMVFPALLFIIAVRQAFGDSLNGITFGVLPRGVMTLVIIFSVLGWFYPARIVRGQVLSLREKEFIEAARMTGAGDFRIMRSHLLPHLVAPVVVLFSISVASNIIGEAGLSFLGLGIEPPTPSWGVLLQEAASYYLTQPWLMVWPGLSILFATLAFNLVGDALRDAFDPRGVG
jgi:ABC-type dipeptide/oligopeptide/nickel transport system permease subunit